MWLAKENEEEEGKANEAAKEKNAFTSAKCVMGMHCKK